VLVVVGRSGLQAVRMGLLKSRGEVLLIGSIAGGATCALVFECGRRAR
jgi:hypothetical protein